jgi:ABC-type multidrug transport system ATPase subunit
VRAVELDTVRVVYRSGWSIRALLRGDPASTARVALDGLSLVVGAGESVGLTGPNGAGKTTVLRVLAGLVVPVAGVARVAGVDVAADPARVAARVGFVSVDDRSFFHRLSVWENIRFFAAMYGIGPGEADRRLRRLGALGLDGLLSAPFRVLSAGQRARVALARGLLHDPSVLLLDEVTRSMDEASRAGVWSLLHGFCDAGGAIVAASHDPLDLQRVSRAITLVDGRLV